MPSVSARHDGGEPTPPRRIMSKRRFGQSVCGGLAVRGRRHPERVSENPPLLLAPSGFSYGRTPERSGGSSAPHGPGRTTASPDGSAGPPVRRHQRRSGCPWPSQTPSETGGSATHYPLAHILRNPAFTQSAPRAYPFASQCATCPSWRRKCRKCGSEPGKCGRRRIPKPPSFRRIWGKCGNAGYIDTSSQHRPNVTLTAGATARS